MVGKIFRVLFTRKALRRRNQIIDFETKRVSKAHARKVDREIRNAARKLEDLPESRPILPDTEDEESSIRYTKAFSYKIIFTVFKKISEVVIITIRNDAEDSEDVLNDLGQ